MKILWIFVIVMTSLIVVGATTTISDLSIDSPVGIFKTLNTPDRPLMITDSINNRIIAIFNGNDSFNLEQAEIQATQIGFNSSVTTFLGDVDNIDDVNGQSRFRETNINNGSGASAAFVAVNDVGFSTAFGIGSSNFLFAGEPFFNNAAIFHRSPADFNTAHAFNYDWKWLANELNTTANFSFIESMKLTGSGNIDINGNYSGQTIKLDLFEDKGLCDSTTEGTIAYESHSP